MTPLSAHFSLEEAVASQTAARKGIDNDPPLEVFQRMKQAALGMELVRKELGSGPILISSWYRSEALEREVAHAGFVAWCKKRGIPPIDANWKTYFQTKAHPKGLAVDFTCPSFGPPAAIVKRLVASKVPFDQVIVEFSAWVHISFDGARRQALVIDSEGTREFTA